MRRDAVIKKIVELSAAGAGFRLDAGTLNKELKDVAHDDLMTAIIECGVIPESFGHDSSEEKLYAKYCDILLAEAFKAIGIPCTVIETRADSADVKGETSDYSIVGDAKAFRLSRTAKNQKDFKVTALSDWRGDEDYATLVCPLYQYPKSRSQIYTQAIDENVTLLGYIHLTFIIEHSKNRKRDLSPLWSVGETMQRSNSATAYWAAIDRTVCNVLDQSPENFREFKRREQDILNRIKAAEINHLRDLEQQIHAMTKEQLVQTLIEEKRLASRIDQINGVTL